MCVILGGQVFGDEGVRVLVWNTERGSNPYGETGRERVLKVIRESGADVLLWQESYELEGAGKTLGAWVAEEMGWSIWQGESPHLAVASRFEEVERDFHHPWHGLGVRLRDEKGREFVAWSIWLDWKAPVQWLAVDQPGATDDELVACDTEKSGRFAEAQGLLDHLDGRGLLDAPVPVLVGGDWNSSSHRDWTKETAAVFPHRRELALPISRLMESAGFADAFRVVHPDPVKVPGNTWSPRGEKREDGRGDPGERIDRLYVKNALGRWGLQPVKTTVLPENPADAKGPRESVVFPSDHAAVLIELEWVETESGTAGAFVPEPAAASPGIDHGAPAEVERGFAPTRIAWGSCYRESQPCPMLDRLAAEKPELYLALGDNIYGDTQDMGVLRRKYRRLARQPGWQALTEVARVMGTWDDHDYGADDSGVNYKPREASKEIFLDFFDEPAGSVRRSREGIYTSTILGTGDRRVQVVMLDLRTFRSPLAKARKKAYPELGRYRPLREDEEQVMLGEVQWQWLEEELRKPAEVRLIGLSTQLGTAHNGYEAWANMPRERERFFQLLETTRAEGVVLFSGDTHWAEVSLVERPGMYPLYDLTSSSLNQKWDPLGENPNRIGEGYTQANAWMMEIDWEAGMLKTRAIDQWGEVRIGLEIPLAELRFGGSEERGEIEGVWETRFGRLEVTKEGDGWVGVYAKGRCDLLKVGEGFEGVWLEVGKGGKCRFQVTRCGRFLQGAYGRGEGEMRLSWSGWRGDLEGAVFRK
ncbi:MAG: alkaline phosphatase D family protein [Verrucomicrobiaceae bacterium]